MNDQVYILWKSVAKFTKKLLEIVERQEMPNPNQTQKKLFGNTILVGERKFYFSKETVELLIFLIKLTEVSESDSVFVKILQAIRFDSFFVNQYGTLEITSNTVMYYFYEQTLLYW